VTARGIYPGGQSGNPGSRRYDDFVSDWAAGKAYDLQFLSHPDSLPPGQSVYALELKPR
jgi:penicillin G amidase